MRYCDVRKPACAHIVDAPSCRRQIFNMNVGGLAGHKLVRVNLSEQTDIMDLLGADLPVPGSGPGAFAWCLLPAPSSPPLSALLHSSQSISALYVSAKMNAVSSTALWARVTHGKAPLFPSPLSPSLHSSHRILHLRVSVAIRHACTFIYRVCAAR